MLYSNNRLLPANIEGDRGLREALPEGAELSAEFLDYPRITGEAYLAALIRFLREKYATRPPAVIVAGGPDALAFVLNRRTELFPQVPVVHMGVPRARLRALPPLPADVVGVPFDLDFAATIDQALRWHPSARRLVFVTGSAAPDRAFETLLRKEAVRLQDRVATEFLAGLPTDALLQRLGELDGESVVFTPGYFQDGAGRNFFPREAVSGLAAAAHAPVYAPFDTFLGTGIVGGYMPTFAAMGRQAGQAVREILAGVAPSALHLPEVMPSTLNLDWRQVLRWGIEPVAIPGDAILHFKEALFLEQHLREALAAAAVVLFQSVLIAWLLTERRRRRLAELAVQQQRFELAHASRLACAGELTASIAHEINQPLGAILSNADAADLILESGPGSVGDRRDDLRAILADIRRDDLRASAVIGRLRGLLAKQAVERQPFDLNEVAGEVATVLGPETLQRRVTLRIRPARAAAMTVGDRVQIQQVLIILVLNALDAVADLAEDRREVIVSVEAGRVKVAVAVRDRGRGIPAADLPQVFESFFTTKPQGMGLGLSIARTLCEAHGGRIWAESGPGPGTVFRVELPAARAAGLAPWGSP